MTVAFHNSFKTNQCRAKLVRLVGVALLVGVACGGGANKSSRQQRADDFTIDDPRIASDTHDLRGGVPRYRGTCTTNCVSNKWVRDEAWTVVSAVLACRWNEPIYATRHALAPITLDLIEVDCDRAIRIILRQTGLVLRRVSMAARERQRAQPKVLAVLPRGSRGGRLVILKPETVPFGAYGFQSPSTEPEPSEQGGGATAKRNEAPSAEATKPEKECQYGDPAPCVFGDSPEQMERNRKANEETTRRRAEQERIRQCKANCRLIFCKDNVCGPNWRPCTAGCGGFP